jgi:hypothetical protein
MRSPVVVLLVSLCGLLAAAASVHADRHRTDGTPAELELGTDRFAAGGAPHARAVYPLTRGQDKPRESPGP